MNNVIKSLFFVICDNRVLYVEAAIKELHFAFSKEFPDMSYITMYRAFKKDDHFTKVYNNKTYHFQALKVND